MIQTPLGARLMTSPRDPLRDAMRLPPTRIAAVHVSTVTPTADVEDHRATTAANLAKTVVIAHPLVGGFTSRICLPRRRRATCLSSASAVGTKARASPRAFTISGIRSLSFAPPPPRCRIPGQARPRASNSYGYLLPSTRFRGTEWIPRRATAQNGEKHEKIRANALACAVLQASA